LVPAPAWRSFHGVGRSGGRFGQYGIHGNGGSLATGDGYRSGAHCRISAVLAVVATCNGQPLPVLYEIYYRRWFMLGWPAFIGVLIIFYLMVAKPALYTV
jgi:hypothetical protein